MNAKILELAKQAGFIMWKDEPWNPGDVIDWSSRYDEEFVKFAELFVRECATIINNIPSSPQGSWSDGYYEGCRDSAKQIKQHFGIEE